MRTFPFRHLPCAIAGLVPASLAAQVDFTATSVRLVAGEKVTLTARWTGSGDPGKWDFALEPPLGDLRQDGTGIASYQAPWDLAGEKDVVITAIPGIDRTQARPLTLHLRPGKAEVPAPREPCLRFLEQPEGKGRAAAVHLAPMDGHPDKALKDHWLVATYSGIRLLTPRNELRHWDGWGEGKGTGPRGTRGIPEGVAINQVAVRSLPGKPWEAAFISMRPPFRLYRMDAHGAITDHQPLDAKTGKPLFQAPWGLAYGLDGFLQVMDSRAGLVYRFRDGKLVDGVGLPASGTVTGNNQQVPHPLALDPGTGSMLMGDGHQLLKVPHPDETRGPDGRPQARPAGVHLVTVKDAFKGIKDVQVAGNRAYIADGPGGIWALELKTGRLDHLTPPRSGPEGPASPEPALPSGACPPGSKVFAVAVNASGRCLAVVCPWRNREESVQNGNAWFLAELVAAFKASVSEAEQLAFYKQAVADPQGGAADPWQAALRRRRLDAAVDKMDLTAPMVALTALRGKGSGRLDAGCFRQDFQAEFIAHCGECIPTELPPREMRRITWLPRSATNTRPRPFSKAPDQRWPGTLTSVGSPGSRSALSGGGDHARSKHPSIPFAVDTLPGPRQPQGSKLPDGRQTAFPSRHRPPAALSLSRRRAAAAVRPTDPLPRHRGRQRHPG